MSLELREDGMFLLQHRLKQMGYQFHHTITGTYVKDPSYICLTATGFDSKEVRGLRFELILLEQKKVMRPFDPIKYDLGSLNGGSSNFEELKFDAMLLYNPSSWEKFEMDRTLGAHEVGTLESLGQLKLVSGR